MPTRFAITLFAMLTGLAAAAPAEAADRYELDKTHSTVHFKVRHMSVSNFVGRFTGFDGRFTLDGDSSKFSFTIKAGSVDSNSEQLDGHIKSPDFLSAKEFPNITFKSSKVKANDKGYAVTGDLKIRGKSKSITAQINKVGEGMTRFGYKYGLESTFTINRRDFGVNYGTADAVGDDVTLIVNMEGNRK